MELAYYCIDNPAHTFSGENLDGVRCPYCDGMVKLKPMSSEDYEKIPKYRELKKYRYKAQCLVCNHTKVIRHEGKRSYKEVTVCPSCNKGALVDVWKLGKYLSQTPTSLEGSNP